MKALQIEKLLDLNKYTNIEISKILKVSLNKVNRVEQNIILAERNKK
jgi:hypothetical protein